MQYLYLVRCNEYYKIGIANDVDSRMAALQIGNPYPLALEACFGFPNAEIVERALHQKFSQNNVRGEWFILTGKLVTEYKHLCSALGGFEQEVSKTIDANAVREAEELQDLTLERNEGARWDFHKMFADGWRMETNKRRKKTTSEYWMWRKGSNSNRKALYGGKLADLPYPLSEMKDRFR